MSTPSSAPSDVRRFVLWAAADEPPATPGVLYRWNGRLESASVRSLLNYAERHGDFLRSRYLAWIHDLGETQIAGKRIIDHLAVGGGPSLWWTTLLAEKSSYKSPISDAIRLLALDEVVREHGPTELVLVGGTHHLHLAVSDLCASVGIRYQWERRPGTHTGSWVRVIYRRLPHSVRGLLSLARHVRTHWPLRRAKGRFVDGKGSLLLCSYFSNFDARAGADGHFACTNYWVGFPALLRRKGLRANWIQIFVPSERAQGPRAAAEWADRFNRERGEEGSHAFVDGYLSWRVVMRVLKRWAALNVVASRLPDISAAFRPKGSRITLWPLLRVDWNESVRGKVAVANILWIELFDEALRRMPRQSRGFYLSENQAWERALIHAWRKHGHGQLIAVVHSTVRFWDLRYYNDSRTLRSSLPHAMPMPDLTAMNGRASTEAFRSVGFPEEAMVGCEALRYQYLRAGSPMRDPRGGGSEPLRVLILGDYASGLTRRMLHLLEQASTHLSMPVSFTARPHPSSPIVASDFPTLDFRIRSDPLANLLQMCDVAYSSNATSAAVDAYLAGVPVVVLQGETELNFSPLLGQPDARFVSTAEELAKSLEAAHRGAGARCEGADFFFLDAALPRWRQLLESEPVAKTMRLPPMASA